MSVLFIAQLHVTDMDALRREYGAHLGPINARHGAEPVAFHPAADLIEGEGPAPAIAVLRFPLRAARCVARRSRLRAAPEATA